MYQRLLWVNTSHFMFSLNIFRISAVAKRAILDEPCRPPQQFMTDFGRESHVKSDSE